MKHSQAKKNGDLTKFTEVHLRFKGSDVTKTVEQQTPPSGPLRKDQQLQSYLQTKTALAELWRSLKKLQQHGGTKKTESNCTKREGRTASVCLYQRTNQAGIARSQKGISQVKKSSPHQKSESEVSNQLPYPSGALHEGSRICFGFTQPENGKAETYRDCWEQGRKAEATCSSHTTGATTFLLTCSANTSSFHY